MDLALLGLGQIGGSIARAALASGYADRVVAWTPRGQGPAAAAAHGIASTSSAAEAVASGDLVVLAAPPLACLALLLELAGPLRDSLRPDAVITDVASTKSLIAERAEQVSLRFVGGHPMAGREASGYGSADPDLFQDRPWVIVPARGVDDAAIDRVEALAVACRATPVRFTAAGHDEAVALISHAPLVLSAALAEAAADRPEWPAARTLAAGGWASMTRLARGEPEMGVGILMTNGVATANAVRAVAGKLDEWLRVLETGGPAGEAADHLNRARDVASER